MYFMLNKPFLSPELLDDELNRLTTFYNRENNFISAKINNIQGVVSIRKTVLPGMAIPMLKIRRPNGRLIFNMEIAIRR